ncbi:hypothetical protein EIP91_011187 [Steccherinum ochraceum]|uniref:Uncharacterized protein n=1 Tax=Steccherinum ochraceum TaxID=92696 RepID=A0A4R0QZY6_9APHY|nr:hypothetical protein EIP91_011187 [Steccherinum ochraceum]
MDYPFNVSMASVAASDSPPLYSDLPLVSMETPGPGDRLPAEDDQYRVKAFVEVDLNVSAPRGAPSVVHGGVNGPRDHSVEGGEGANVSTPHLKRIDVVASGGLRVSFFPDHGDVPPPPPSPRNPRGPPPIRPPRRPPASGVSVPTGGPMNGPYRPSPPSTRPVSVQTGATPHSSMPSLATVSTSTFSEDTSMSDASEDASSSEDTSLATPPSQSPVPRPSIASPAQPLVLPLRDLPPVNARLPDVPLTASPFGTPHRNLVQAVEARYVDEGSTRPTVDALSTELVPADSGADVIDGPDRMEGPRHVFRAMGFPDDTEHPILREPGEFREFAIQEGIIGMTTPEAARVLVNRYGPQPSAEAVAAVKDMARPLDPSRARARSLPTVLEMPETNLLDPRTPFGTESGIRPVDWDTLQAALALVALKRAPPELPLHMRVPDQQESVIVGMARRGRDKKRSERKRKTKTDRFRIPPPPRIRAKPLPPVGAGGFLLRVKERLTRLFRKSAKADADASTDTEVGSGGLKFLFDNVFQGFVFIASGRVAGVAACDVAGDVGRTKVLICRSDGREKWGTRFKPLSSFVLKKRILRRTLPFLSFRSPLNVMAGLLDQDSDLFPRTDSPFPTSPTSTLFSWDLHTPSTLTAVTEEADTFSLTPSMVSVDTATQLYLESIARPDSPLIPPRPPPIVADITQTHLIVWDLDPRTHVVELDESEWSSDGSSYDGSSSSPRSSPILSRRARRLRRRLLKGARRLVSRIVGGNAFWRSGAASTR